MTIPALVAVLTAGEALAASTSAQTTVPARVSSRHIAFDHPIVVTGTVPQAAAGHSLDLEFLPAGSSSWQSLASGRAGADGRYRLVARLRRSGYVRVVDPSSSGVVSAVGTATDASSGAQHVSVSAGLQLRWRAFAALGPQTVAVRGRFLPRLGGRIVVLQVRVGRSWRTVASTRTGGGGRFTLRYTPSAGSSRIRVRFAGDALNAKSTAQAGIVTVYAATVASWYYDGGNTACGFHAYYGVANRYLPCGTKVKLLYGGRTLTATVDDRGPYVGGRTWDLNQNTASALGFVGVETVWSSF